MKAYEIAEAFRAQFAADLAFAGTSCEHEQTGNTGTRPRLIFAVTTKPLSQAGSTLRFHLTVTAESNADAKAPTDPDPAIAHASRVEAVRRKLLGTGREALAAALHAAGAFDFAAGWSPDDSDPSVSVRTFETAISISGPVRVL